MQTAINTTNPAQAAANTLAQAAQAAGSSRRVTDQIARKVVEQTGATYREAQNAAINAVNEFVTSSRKPYNLEQGYVASRHNEVNNGWVVIYRLAAGYEVACKLHGTTTTASSLPKARPFLKVPGFCAACMNSAPVVVAELAQGKTAPPVTENAGYIVHSGTTTVYEASEQAIDTKGKFYAVVCEAHGYIKGAKVSPEARALMAAPHKFCPECKKLTKKSK